MTPKRSDNMHIYTFVFNIKILNQKDPKLQEILLNRYFLTKYTYTLCPNFLKVSRNYVQRFKKKCVYTLLINIFNIWPKFKRAEIPGKIIN